MAVIEYKEHEFGTPYKRFMDLEVGDDLYFINLEDLLVELKHVRTVDVKDTSDYFAHNRNSVEYSVWIKNGTEKLEVYKTYDGNSFIDYCSVAKNNVIVCTDERISKAIIEVLRLRNNIQWEKFTSIFGNPMDAYATKEVILM